MKTLRSAVCSAVAFGLCALLLFVSPSRMAFAAVETIRIGNVFSLTGWAGMLGSAQRDITLAWAEDINRKGGLLGKQIEVFVEDDQSSPTTAVVAATKLVRDLKVNVLVAATTSDAAMAIAPIAEQEQVPYIVTSPVLISLKKFVFPIGPGDVKMAAHTLELAVTQLGGKRMALLHDTALYGTQGAKIMNKELSRFPGSSFVVQEKFEPKDTNMIPQLTKIKALNPDLLVVYGTGATCAIIAKNYKQLGMTTPVLGGGGLAAPDFVKLGGNIAEEMKWGIMVFKFSVAESLPPNDSYRRNVYEPMKKIYQDKYGKDKAINLFHGTFDAFTMASLAISAAGKIDRASIRDALEKVRFEGVFGYVAPGPTDHQEGAIDTSLIGVLKNGKFVPYAR